MGVKPQYATFISREVKLNLSSFRDMNFQETRVDEFLGKFIIPLSLHYNHLWRICIIIFCITYGQAAIQWGFNVNKDMLSENLQESSLIARRIVYDKIKAIN